MYSSAVPNIKPVDSYMASKMLLLTIKPFDSDGFHKKMKTSELGAAKYRKTILQLWPRQNR